MIPSRLERLLQSIFTRLLVATLVTGLALTVTVVFGFMIIRFHSEGLFERNLLLYTEYLRGDLGDPPSEERAREISSRTGMVIRFVHSSQTWQTGHIPKDLNFEKAWRRQYGTRARLGSSKGHHFIQLSHSSGELTFIASRNVKHGKQAIWILAVMALGVCTILGLAHLYIRKIFKPIHALKTGVDRVGAGELQHRIAESGNGELRDLAKAFNTMTARLATLMNSKERLLLDVSHELRTPITRMKVQLEFVDDADIRKSLNTDLLETESMVTMLLESARLRHTSAALNLQVVDMEELIRSVIDDFKDAQPGIEPGSVDALSVRADPDKMKIVLRNLLENALRHTPGDGLPVVVSIGKLPGSLKIVVEDRGEGIPEADISYLFEPFYRPDNSRSRKTGGYGLGLSLCKAIIDAHGGAIDLVSTLGEGTRVTVELPR